MFTFILFIISSITLIMCIKLFRRLYELECKINLLDPSLRYKRKSKGASDGYAPLATSEQSPSTQKVDLAQVVKQGAVTFTSKPESSAFPEVAVKKPAAVSTPKPLTEKPKPSEPVRHVPLSDNARRSASVTSAVEESPKEVSMEQVIGTRWIPIAGIILLVCGAAFFLKFAYENFTVPPLYRVLVVAGCGFAGLVVGEITRRRQYEIVAKSVTAMGFGLLYAAVFAANNFYHILGTWPALTLGVVITATAMLYAVVLDEIVIAFLSLLGGYLTPIIISTGHDLPVPLFTYLLVLSVGAIQCAYYRKWRAVNLLTFVGSFALYALWFFKYYSGSDSAGQMPIALTALAAFFTVFLVMPILYELIKKTKVGKEDVLLVLMNSAVTYCFLYLILNPGHRLGLAFATAGLAAVHLVMMAIAKQRSKDDSDLHIVLLVISMVFFTISLPLFFTRGTLSLVWAAQGVVLAVIGVRYKCLTIRLFGLAALALSCVNLLWQFPMHTGQFRLIFNPAFGVWLTVAAAAYVNHLVYRHRSEAEDDLYGLVSQILYGLMGVLLVASSIMEWYFHCRYNLSGRFEYMFVKALPSVFAAAVAMFYIRPVCPAGKIREGFALLVTGAGVIVTLMSLIWLHNESFLIVLNMQFILAAVFPATLAVCHVLYRFVYTDVSEFEKNTTSQFYAITCLVTMLIATAEWYFHCSLSLDSMMPAVIIGQVIIFAFSIPLFIVRPVSPMGKTTRTISVLLGLLGSVFTVAASIFFYQNAFRIFLNPPFAASLAFVASLAVSSVLLRREDSYGRGYPELAAFFGLSFVVVLWALLTEQIFMYWYCMNRYEVAMENWIYRAYMYISIMWALYAAGLMVVGFWRRVPTLRYVALGLFGLLLAKIFIIDTSQVENIYRIAAFIATGIVLVGVSYLYQFLKKKNFFENLTASAIISEDDD